MTESSEGQQVCVIGLGLMGSALAEALLNAGHDVTVWNRTPAKAGPLTAKGARGAASAAEAINASDITLVCVTNHAAAMEILGTIPEGALDAGKCLVQLSTMTPDECSELARLAAQHRLGCLEGSILGTPSNVTGGTATIIVSGPREAFDAGEAVLRAFGDAKYLSSEVGTACSFDKVWYAYAYGVHAAFFQGAALAHAKGFALDAFFDTVKARTPALVEQCMVFGEKIAARDHPATMGRLDIWAEPFNETLALCKETGVDDGLPATMMRNFERAIAAGHGRQELSALFEVLIPSRKAAPDG
jgi:3-hydroxyisobutyrate dehydrogenase-like beta-hydroxyacid dehydrogenase